MILGLDVSTSITGATVIDENDKVVFCEAWDTRKFKSFFEKASYIRSKLVDTKARFPITKIVIEQSLQMFRAGFSSAKTLTTLSKFNGAVSWMCYHIWSLEPEYVSATTARKNVGIRVKRGQKAKAVVLQFVLDNEPQFDVQYTRHGNPRPECFDRADSWVVAKAGYNLWQQEKKRS
tara:strand:- start:376 stop:906 length:531 start_codon:yes stop_codon:yes gene_type:complete